MKERTDDISKRTLTRTLATLAIAAHTVSGVSHTVLASGIRPALTRWRTVTVAPGIDGSLHPGVPRSLQDAIDWCRKQLLVDTAANRAKGVVWLTFDDSGSSTQVKSIVATLKW